MNGMTGGRTPAVIWKAFMDEQQADAWQYSLRPRKLNEYIGQDKVKENLSIFVKAALSRGEALDHAHQRLRRS